jgi:hypothetical protein
MLNANGTCDQVEVRVTMVHRGALALGCALVLAILSIAPSMAAPAAPASPAATGVRWAWVTARQPTNTTEYAPAPIDQGNSTGSGNTAEFLGGLGRYHVRFGGVGTGGSEGVVHVTALGNTSNTCGIESWNPEATDIVASIYCKDALGQDTTSRFTATFLATDTLSGRLAYLATSVADADSTPVVARNFNSTGGTNTVHHNVADGDYSVTLPGLGSHRGDVQVTAIGTYLSTSKSDTVPAGTPDSRSCMASWGPSGTDMLVHVTCFDASGSPVDTNFTLTFMQALGLKGTKLTKVAYLLANKATTASYTPTSAYWYSSAGQASHITRLATGTYRVDLPGLPKGGAAVVTATGPGARHCVVGGIRTDGTPQRLTIRCWDFSGNPTDSAFALAYER